jgi:hypothetical protein
VATLQLIHGGIPNFSDGIPAMVARSLGDPSLPSCALTFAVVPRGLVGAAIRAFLGTARLVREV